MKLEEAEGAVRAKGAVTGEEAVGEGDPGNAEGAGEALGAVVVAKNNTTAGEVYL